MYKAIVKRNVESSTMRKSLIKKIKNGLNNKSINHTKDPEVEEFQLGYLENWKDLTQYEPIANDLKVHFATDDLTQVNKKELDEEIKKLKDEFIEWLSDEDALSEGMAWGEAKRQDITETIKSTPGNAAKKIKSTIHNIFNEDGSKVGRNNPCPCDSNIKYKKCCGAYKNER